MNVALSWKNIHSLGKTKALQLSYIFFVFVPVIVSLYKKAEAFSLPLFELPFSWVALFFAALSISIANTIYFMFCPDIVKQFSSYQEFMTSGRGASFIARQLALFVPKSERAKSIEDIATYLFNNYKHYIHADSKVFPIVKRDLQTPGAQVSQAMFWITYDIANNLQRYWRISASICYYIGFVLLSIVFLQKLKMVLFYLLS